MLAYAVDPRRGLGGTWIATTLLFLMTAPAFPVLQWAVCIWLFMSIAAPVALIAILAFSLPRPRPLAEANILFGRIATILNAPKWAALTIVPSALGAMIAQDLGSNDADVLSDYFIIVVLLAAWCAYFIAMIQITFDLRRIPAATRIARIDAFLLFHGPRRRVFHPAIEVIRGWVRALWIDCTSSSFSAVFVALWSTLLGPLGLFSVIILVRPL